MTRSALVANLVAARREAPHAGVDLRRDACGHGARIVAEAAREAGVRTALADAPDPGLELGLDAGDPAHLLPLESVYGLAGRGRPALTLTGRVLQTKPLRAGEGVSYGYRYRASRDTRVALVSGGYAQGVVRALGGQASVRIAGEEHPIVGRIAMDVCVVEIGDARVADGEEAVFFGAAHPDALAGWARAAGLTEVELVAVAGLRATREVAE